MAISARTSSPLKPRALATLLDMGAVAAYLMLLGGIAVVIEPLTRHLTWNLFTQWLAGFVILMVPVGVYLWRGEAGPDQASPGKRWQMLQVVVAETGARPGKVRIAVRTIVKLLPIEITRTMVLVSLDPVRGQGGWITVALIAAGCLPVLYLVAVIVRIDRRAPHDVVAGTQVIVE